MIAAERPLIRRWSICSALVACLVGAAPAHAVTRVLITNDDGPLGPGLQALYTAFKALPDTELQVVVPAGDASGTGAGFTIMAPFTVVPNVPLLNGSDTAYSVSSNRPADCVRWAVLRLYAVDSPPDFVVSGINRGQNPGAAFGSGTVGGALAANDLGIRSIAISQAITFTDPQNLGGALADYESGAAFAAELMQSLINNAPSVWPLSHHLARGGLLNVQIPPRTPMGVRIVRAGNARSFFGRGLLRYQGTLGTGASQFTPQINLRNIDAFHPAAIAQGLGTDFGAVGAGYIAIVPWTVENVGRASQRPCCSELLP